MRLSHRPSLAAALAVITIGAAAWTGGARLRAQQGPLVWQFEDVAAPRVTNCVTGATLGGFEYGPDGRPVLLWREENSCGGGPRVFWTRKENGAWTTNEFQSEHRAGAFDQSHRLILRPA